MGNLFGVSIRGLHVMVGSGSSAVWLSSIMGKVRLFVRVRKQGCRIESVPLKRLLKLANYRKKRWEYRDGWLILEAF
jgi:hypothetical protein